MSVCNERNGSREAAKLSPRACDCWGAGRQIDEYDKEVYDNEYPSAGSTEDTTKSTTQYLVHRFSLTRSVKFGVFHNLVF